MMENMLENMAFDDLVPVWSEFENSTNDWNKMGSLGSLGSLDLINYCDDNDDYRDLTLPDDLDDDGSGGWHLPTSTELAHQSMPASLDAGADAHLLHYQPLPLTDQVSFLSNCL